jgi:hypothetical protein
MASTPTILSSALSRTQSFISPSALTTYITTHPNAIINQLLLRIVLFETTGDYALAYRALLDSWVKAIALVPAYPLEVVSLNIDLPLEWDNSPSDGSYKKISITRQFLTRVSVGIWLRSGKAEHCWIGIHKWEEGVVQGMSLALWEQEKENERRDLINAVWKLPVDYREGTEGSSSSSIY